MIKGIESGHSDSHIVDHQDKNAYLPAYVPDSTADPPACKARAPYAGIQTNLPPHEGDIYPAAFLLKNVPEHPRGAHSSFGPDSGNE